MNVFDNLNLAESKLILLYTINEFNIPITNNQITSIMIENNIMNYFSLQQYLTELKSSNFITVLKGEGPEGYLITEEGKKILAYFINRVPLTFKEKIQSLVESNLDKVKQQIEITAEYIPEKETEYIVECKVNENRTNLITLKINVPTKSQAKSICQNWEDNASTIYSEILESLIKERSQE